MFFNPDKIRIAFMDFSSRYAIVCSSLSVQATSSASMAFEVDDGIGEDGKGKIYSMTISSTAVLKPQWVNRKTTMICTRLISPDFKIDTYELKNRIRDPGELLDCKGVIVLTDELVFSIDKMRHINHTFLDKQGYTACRDLLMLPDGRCAVGPGEAIKGQGSVSAHLFVHGTVSYRTKLRFRYVVERCFVI
jgi:hypothetical protein